MPGKLIPRQLMFDPEVPGCFRPMTRQEIQTERLPKPGPVDVFWGDPEEKLHRIGLLKDDDGALTLALDAVRHFFYGDREKLTNEFLSRDTRYDCGIDLYYELSRYLLDEERWVRLLGTEPLHVCYTEFVKPLKEFVADLLQTIENKRERVG